VFYTSVPERFDESSAQLLIKRRSLCDSRLSLPLTRAG
jgi:hypothetical protein